VSSRTKGYDIDRWATVIDRSRRWGETLSRSCLPSLHFHKGSPTTIAYHRRTFLSRSATTSNKKRADIAQWPAFSLRAYYPSKDIKEARFPSSFPSFSHFSCQWLKIESGLRENCVLNFTSENGKWQIHILTGVTYLLLTWNENSQRDVSVQIELLFNPLTYCHL